MRRGLAESKKKRQKCRRPRPPAPISDLELGKNKILSRRSPRRSPARLLSRLRPPPSPTDRVARKLTRRGCGIVNFNLRFCFVFFFSQTSTPAFMTGATIISRVLIEFGAGPVERNSKRARSPYQIRKSKIDEFWAAAAELWYPPSVSR